MLKRILLLVVLFSFPATARAEWSDARFGMTLSEVMKKVPTAHRIGSDENSRRTYSIYRGDNCLLVEDEVMIGDMKFNAIFNFDNSGRLSSINLTGNENYYYIIADILSQKYGRPTTLSTGSLPRMTWSDANNHRGIRLDRIGVTIISYHPISSDL